MLAPDQFVRTDGAVADGCLEADRIQIYDPDDEAALESFRSIVLTGEPSGEAAYLFTMSVAKTRHGEEGDEVSVTADATTLVCSSDGTPVPLENVPAGTWLEVEAEASKD